MHINLHPTESQLYRRKFLHSLAPFFDMLENLKLTMNDQEWFRMVNRTESSVILLPDQYLGQDRPTLEVTGVIIKEIFEEFIKQQVGEIEESLA